MAAQPIDSMPQQDNNSQPLQYKTWVLKVSIHCEGCKRKVKRILHSVEGVYTIDVDARQHKVVVTGNVDGNTLVRKLEKSGKHAELWSDNFHQLNNNNNEQQNQNQNQNPNIENQNVTFNLDQPHNNSNSNSNSESQRVAENCGPPPQQHQHQQQHQQQQQQVKEVRFEGNAPGEQQKPPGPGGNDGGAGGGAGGAAKKKKKKKKGHNGNNNTTTTPNNGTNNNNNNNPNNNGADVASNGVMEQHGPNSGPPSAESQPHPTHHQSPNPNPGNMSPTRHPQNCRVYEYPPPYYTPPPVYAVSYNTAYPSSNYRASYYSTPPPYSYAYVHQGGDVDASAPLDWNPNAVPPSDSFEMFSDENPNACAVM